MRIIVGLGVLVLLADYPAVAQLLPDYNASEACSAFAVALRDGRDGIATGSELREQIQRVYAKAMRAHSEDLRQAATALLRAATQREGVVEAAKAMLAACGVRVDRPTTAISEDEAARQLRSVLERAGGPVNCRQKQYGSGWVTVCD